MHHKAAVIIPCYKEKLNPYEQIALSQCQKILGQQHIIAIKPEGLVLPKEMIDVVGNTMEEFESYFFDNIQGYNRLMLSPTFYERFLKYDYVLIYQLDCFVFKDELAYWCAQKWDYIGAPWIRKTYHKNAMELLFAKIGDFVKEKLKPANNFSLIDKVGNGGFSLRNVKKFHEICISMREEIEFYLKNPSDLHNEDVFWSLEVNKKCKKLNIPDVNTAIKFAYEVPPLKTTKFDIESAPFGCHDWDHYKDFWSPIFRDYGYSI